jgi:ketosteroid isomerase-like protein
MRQVLKLLSLLLLFSPSCKTINSKSQTNQAMTTETGNITKQTLAAVDNFNAAINRHDIDAVMNAMTDDCVFENTNPPPDGGRFVGADAVKAFWQKFFDSNPDAVFEAEEIFATGDRCVVRWVYRKTKDGKPWHLRGVDVFRIRNGKVAEKLAYVKG